MQIIKNLCYCEICGNKKMITVGDRCRFCGNVMVEFNKSDSFAPQPPPITIFYTGATNAEEIVITPN